ncbi:MAG: NYN domain-containing protein [Myxococcota bacterium]
MSRNAALLIDLENFYLARETTAEVGTDEPYDFIGDLERLCGFARSLVGDARRLIVRRAYADFSASRLNDDVEIGRPRREYFLRSVPTVLMDQGIEPVQVFRFPGSGRGVTKNAADMRLAMDAISLIANVDFFILVTGDKDFIPVVLELRQRGAFVVGLGAHGSIARTLTAYCDAFHEFETLAAAERRASEEIGFDEVKQALHDLLAERGRLHFARVKPLLDQRLGASVDPRRLGSDSMGELLRDQAEPLGVKVSRALHDWEVELPRSDESAAAPPVIEVRPHSIGLYRRLLLAPGKLRLHIHDYRRWREITDHLFETATNPDGTPAVVFHHELRGSVIEHFADEGLQHVGKITNDALFLIFKAGCFVCAEPGPRYGEPDFNWSHYSARLAPGIGSAAELRRRAYTFAVQQLSDRLHDYDGRRPEAELVAGLLFGPEPGESELERARELVGAEGDAVVGLRQ